MQIMFAKRFFQNPGLGMYYDSTPCGGMPMGDKIASGHVTVEKSIFEYF